MIEKSLYQAPVGLDSILEEPIEIEIEDPKSVSIEMGGMEIEIEPAPETAEDFDANLAEYMSEGELTEIAGDLLGDFEDDVSARKDWIQTYVDGLELLGMKLEDRTEPWEGACGVYHPLLSEALVKFQSETIMETFPAAGPVKTVIIGKETQEKKDAAQRVQDDMNYQLTDVMTEFRPEHERMIWGLGLAGNAFKKVYYDPHLERQVSMFIPAEDIVVPYGASSLESAPRVTHVMRKTENEVKRLQYAGFYRDVDLDTPSGALDEVEKKIAEKMGFRATTDDRYKLLEIHVDLDLPGYEDKEDGKPTGIALPYVVTIERDRKRFCRSVEIGDPKMRRTKNGIISSIMATCQALVFTVLALFTLSALLLSLVLLLSDNLSMLVHYRICQAALKPEVCELRETTPPSRPVSLET